MTKTLGAIIAFVVIVGILAPFAIYHFLIAPNVIGVIAYLVPGEGPNQELNHFSYWLGFWVFIPCVFGMTLRSAKD